MSGWNSVMQSNRRVNQRHGKAIQQAKRELMQHKIPVRNIRIVFDVFEFEDMFYICADFESYKSLVGENILASSFAPERIFTLVPDDIDGKRRLVIKHITNDTEKEPFDLPQAVNDSSSKHIEGVVLPAFFNKDQKFKDFEEDQVVFNIASIEMPGYGYSDEDYTINVDFCKIKQVHENSLLVELEAIPGQTQYIYNPTLAGPKLNILPFIM